MKPKSSYENSKLQPICQPASQPRAPTTLLARHAFGIYYLLATGMLLFGHCRDFKMHKNTRKEYIFYPACIGDGCILCTKYSFQLVDQKEDKDRQG